MATHDFFPEGDPTDPAHQDRLVADEAERAARYHQFADALHARLGETSFSLVQELVEAHAEWSDAMDRIREAQLDRHFPALAPALGLARAHCLEQLERFGQCCAWVPPAPGSVSKG